MSKTNTGSRAAVLRRSEPTRLSSPSDDKVGGFPARSARSERSNQMRSKMIAMPWPPPTHIVS
ncbi:MAG TPA: hypothetical protein VI074_08945, partial [Propionibacteriaceae bacterium]